MSRPDKISIPAAITIVAVAVIALIASGVLRPSTATGATPTASPTAPPPATPAAPDPTGYPDDFSDNNKTVQLDVGDHHDVFVMVKDEVDAVVDARTGHAAEGMSVDFNDMKVENIGPSTLRLTWVSWGVDDKIDLNVGMVDGQLKLSLVQAGATPTTDATGHDRVLDLELGFAVDAADVLTSVQSGLASDS
jgi:hypothetical protein